MSIVITSHKEMEISVRTDGMFSANGISGDYPTMEAVKAAIDKATSVKYKPIPGIIIAHESYMGAVVIQEVSVTRPHGHQDRKEFWIKRQNGTRATSNAVAIDSPNNREIAQKIIVAYAEQAKLSREIDQLRRSLDRNFNLQIVTK